MRSCYLIACTARVNLHGQDGRASRVWYASSDASKNQLVWQLSQA